MFNLRFRLPDCFHQHRAPGVKCTREQSLSTSFNNLKVLHVLLRGRKMYKIMRIAAKPQTSGYQAKDVWGHQMVLGLECVHAQGNLVASEAKLCQKTLTQQLCTRFDASAGFR